MLIFATIGQKNKTSIMLAKLDHIRDQHHRKPPISAGGCHRIDQSVLFAAARVRNAARVQSRNQLREQDQESLPSQTGSLQAVSGNPARLPEGTEGHEGCTSFPFT